MEYLFDSALAYMQRDGASVQITLRLMNKRIHTIPIADHQIDDLVSPVCRPGCGACCISPSISSAIPGMPMGKPAGVRCVQLDDENRFQIFGSSERPAVCGS